MAEDNDPPWVITGEGGEVKGEIILGFDPASDGGAVIYNDGRYQALDSYVWDAPLSHSAHFVVDELGAREWVKPEELAFKMGGSLDFLEIDETHNFLPGGGPIWAMPEPKEQALTIKVDYLEPDLPPLFFKGKDLTGKQYRQYRRAHRRLRQQWKKNGKPMRHRMMYFPKAQVIVEEVTKGVISVGAAAQAAGVAMSSFADAFAMHPSNWKIDG